MLNIKQFKYRNDNLAYVVYGHSEAIAIDPGCPENIFKFINSKKIKLTYILNTHSHKDHTMGNEGLQKLTGVRLSNRLQLQTLYVDSEFVAVIDTPGHTLDSVCFVANKFVITGDTLFVANIGNCSDSNLKLFKESLDKLLDLPSDTLVYPGHDYTKRSLDFACGVDSRNVDIEKFSKWYKKSPVFSKIGWEKKINPYLRAQTNDIKSHLKNKGLCVDTEFDCFNSLMKLYKKIKRD